MSPRPAGSKTPGQHGAFVVAVKQERGEGARAGDKGSQEEEVSHPLRAPPRPGVTPLPGPHRREPSHRLARGPALACPGLQRHPAGSVWPRDPLFGLCRVLTLDLQPRP